MKLVSYLFFLVSILVVVMGSFGLNSHKALAQLAPTPVPSLPPAATTVCGTVANPVQTGSDVSACEYVIAQFDGTGNWTATFSDGFTFPPVISTFAVQDTNILYLFNAPTVNSVHISSSGSNDSGIFEISISPVAFQVVPSATPVPTAVPTSYSTFVPQAMGAMYQSQGFDIGAAGGVVGTASKGNYNFQQLQTLVAAKQIRGNPTNSSGFATPSAYFDSLVNTTNLNNGACFVFSTQAGQNAASQTTTITQVIGASQGGTYNPSALPPCVIEEGPNELNAAINSSGTYTTLSAATTAGQAQTENVPSGAVNYCNGPTGSNSTANGYYNCAGAAWISICDGTFTPSTDTCSDTSPETVLVTSAVGGTSWTATFAKTHTTSATAYLNTNWVLAGWQYEAWENLYNNQTGHTEFAAIPLTTVPLSYIYSASETVGSIVNYNAAMQALTLQVGLCTAPTYPNGCNLWNIPPGYTEPLSDRLNFHTSPQYYYLTNAPSSSSLNQWREFGLAMQQLYCTGGWSGNTCSGTQATPQYPWEHGFYCGECLFATGADFCYSSANVPSCPGGTNFTDLPQVVTAQYITSEHYIMAASFANITGQTPQILEPIPNCGASGTLNNWYLDCAPNPVPAAYSVGNTAPFFYDSIYNVSTFTPHTLAFTHNAGNDLCVTYPTLTVFTFGPTGCLTQMTITQSQDGATYTIQFHRVPSGYGLYPQVYAANPPTPGNTATPCPAPPNGVGQCPNQSPPPVNAQPTTLTYTISNPVVINGSRIPTARIQQARVYHQSQVCNIRSNVANVVPYATPTPDPTPSPTYGTAANTECYDYPNSVLYTLNGGTISIPFPADASDAIVVMSTNLNTPLPIQSAMPMLTPVATPSPGPSGLDPWNYYRSGTFNPLVNI